MADERTRQPLLRCSTFRHPWRSQAPYNHKGLLGPFMALTLRAHCARAQIRSRQICQDPAKLRRLMLGFQLAAHKGFNQPIPFINPAINDVVCIHMRAPFSLREKDRLRKSNKALRLLLTPLTLPSP